MLATTALAAALALYRLGARSLWLDEGFTFAVASQHGAHLLQAALKDGGNAVAYYVGMHYWTRVFGSSEASLRLPAVISAIATVPVCFSLLKKLFDLPAAVLGSLCVAVSVPFIWWAQNARSYTVAVLLVCAATLAFVIAVQSGKRWAWAAYVALVVLSIYTVLLSALIVVVHAISLLFGRWPPGRWRLLVLAVAASAVLAAPLAWVLADHYTRPAQWVAAPGGIFGVNDHYLFDFLASSRSVDVPFRPSTVTGTTVAAVLCWALGSSLFIATWVRCGRSEKTWAYGLLFSWFIIPPGLTLAISYALQPILSDRYILNALPPASMVAGVALSRLRPWPVAVAGGLVLLALRGSVTAPGYGAPLENWRQGALDIMAKSRPGDCIAFFVADGYDSFDYYVLHLRNLPGPVPRPVLPATTWPSRAPYALDPAVVPRSQVPELMASCPRLWLVSSHDAGSAPGPGVPPYRVRVYQAQATLQAELSASYRATPGWWFRGAYVALYVRSSA